MNTNFHNTDIMPVLFYMLQVRREPFNTGNTTLVQTLRCQSPEFFHQRYGALAEWGPVTLWLLSCKCPANL